jgi:hypothetical protein
MPPRKKTTTKPKTVAPSDDQVRIKLLKTEIHYFKGLAISMTVMIFCVFVAFGVLFSAMYLEARATRVIFQSALSDFLPSELALDYDYNYDSEETICESDKDLESVLFGEDEELAEVQVEEPEWLSFSKYGFDVYFPGTWTFSDKPYIKQVHFFSDGVVRQENTNDSGDMIVALVDKDNYRGEYQGALTSIGSKIGYKYIVEDESSRLNVVVVPFENEYLEITFVRTVDDEEIISDETYAVLLGKFSFVQ